MNNLPGPDVAEAAIEIKEDVVQDKLELENKKEDGVDEKKKAKANLSAYFKIFNYANRIDKIIQVIGIFAAIANGAVMPLSTVVFGSLVTKFTALATPGTNYSPDSFKKAVNEITIYFVYLFIAKLILGYIAALCFRVTGVNISARLRLSYLRMLFEQEVSYFDDVGPGTVAVQITSNSNLIQNGISERLGIFFQYNSMWVTALIIALVRSWELALVTLCIIPAICIIYAVALPMIIKLEAKTSKIQEDAANLAQETFSTIRTVVAFGAQDNLGERYSKLLFLAQKIGLTKGPIYGAVFGAGMFGVFSAYALAFWYGIRIYVRGRIHTSGVIVTVLFCIMFLFFAIGQLTPLIEVFGKAGSAASGVFELEARESKKEAKETGIAGKSLVDTEGEITFQDIDFAYPSRPDVTVLNKLNMTFKAKENTAIVGSSGAGKSTIVGLIERWYEPTNGTISLDGHNLKDVDLKWLRSIIGFVQQEPFLFNDTIYNNVCFGMIGSKWENSSEEVKRERVKEVCRMAYADTFIEKLPQQYDTQIGEHGIKISGGQKQRVAIARAIVCDPSILILDEATSAIDVKSEGIVQKALDEASKDRTTIVIAHRLSTIMRADRIIVMHKGTVVEEGTHISLLQLGGAYSKLVDAQGLVTMDADESIACDDVLSDNDVKEALIKEKSRVSDDLEKAQLNEDKKVEKPSPIDRKGFIRILIQIFWEQKQFWPFFLGLFVSSVACSAGLPLQAYLFSKIINVFTIVDLHRLETRGNFWALMYFILGIFTFISYIFLGITFQTIAENMARIYRMEYFTNIVRQEMSFFDKEENSSGTLTANLSTDPTQLQEMLGQNFGILTIACVSLVSCCILALAIGWKLSLVAIFSVMPFLFASAFVRVKIEVNFDVSTAKIFASSAQFASEAIGSIRTVSSLTLEDHITKRYQVLLDEHGKEARNKAVLAMAFFSLSEALELLCQALVFWYGSRLLADGYYTPQQYFLIYIAAVQGAQSAGSFLAYTGNIGKAHNASKRILKARELTYVDGTQMPSSAENGCDIEFRNVDFKYPSRDNYVFKNLNLNIRAGQFAAFVGASGSGKTTGVSLIERFYDATGGQILLDGVSLVDLNRVEYRKLISLVPQEPILYQGTLRDNILIGVDHDVSDSEVEDVCRRAYIHEFIMSLPEGYNTQCGVKGLGLSGGQKSRIAIARALIRNPKILLLDEATSALDSESEKIVQKAFEVASVGRTMLAVAHRLSTIQKADIIFVFEEGRIVEQGNHMALLRMKGRYYQMIQAQALNQ